MSILKNSLLTVIVCLIASNVFGQDSATIYYSMDYMKVEPGNTSEYLACEKAWKKIHSLKKEEGAIESWALERVMSPSGSSTAYNFVTRQRFKDRDQLAAYQTGPYFPENWKTLLTEKEIELINRTSELRTYVKGEVWSAEERVLAKDLSDANISVVNYFKIPEGKYRSDHLKMERELWMPFHKQNVEQEKMKAWVLLNRELPMGSDYGYSIITVDVYKDMHQFWEPFDSDGLAKMHPGKSLEEIMNETSEVSIRGSSEIRKAIDSTEQ